MGYEEVETVLPKNFAPKPDPLPAAVPSPKADKQSAAAQAEQSETSDVESVASSVPSSVVSSSYESGTDGSTSASGKKKKKRRNMMQRIKGSWRSVRASRKRNKPKKSSRRGFAAIRKADSNATEVRSNTKKAIEQRALEEEKAEAAETAADPTPLDPVTEGDSAAVANTDPGEAKEPPTPTEEPTPEPTPEPRAPTPEPPRAPTPEPPRAPTPEAVPEYDPDLVKDVSVEIGDENDQFEVGIGLITKAPEVPAPAKAPALVRTRSTDSTSSKNSRASRSSRGSKKSTRSQPIVEDVHTFDEMSVASRRKKKNSYVEDKNKALVPVTDDVTPAQHVPRRSPVTTPEANDEQDSTGGHNAMVVKENLDKKTWVKKVSLSIGGYKTSFQFSDPMANLVQSVNEALDVVSDGALVDEAKALDDEEEAEEERDYDSNPTKLFMYLQQRAWGLALTQLKNTPEEAQVWVYRKQNPSKAPNVINGENSRELVVQSQAVVVHKGDPDKLRWKLLPLHASIVLGAPPEVILEVIKAYPNAARKPDERGSLPVHLAASRLDVDPEGEKIVLQLFGAYPDSIEMQDRKGRTPPELAKLARMRRVAEEKRRHNAFNQEEAGVEKTASSFAEKHDVDDEDDEDEATKGLLSGGDKTSESDAADDDDVSIKSNKSGRWSRMLIQKSKSTDTTDRRKKKFGSKGLLTRAKSADERDTSDKSITFDESVKDGDDGDEMGPGFAILKPSKSYEQRLKTEMEDPASDEEDEDEVNPGFTISQDYTTPSSAPGSTEFARSIPLPMSFCEDDTSKRSPSPASINLGINSNASDCSVSPQASGDYGAESAEEIEPPNEALRVLLEKAAENAGRGGEDVTPHLKTLEDEWVTDVEALRRIDGETLDCLLPILLSREVQRLMNFADNVDDRFLAEDKGNDGKWVRESRERGRSPYKKKSKKRSSRRAKKSAEPRRLPRPESSTQDASLNTISEEHADDDMSVYTEAYPRSVGSVSSKVRINDQPTEMEPKQQPNDYEDTPSDYDNELHIRKAHASLIADARKKFPTRESLEDAIRDRQYEVEVAVNSGFDVDKKTLSRAAMADDEVRKLLPLRLILPTVADLNEMIGVLQVHKENALRNLNLNKAVSIQTEIDELQAQITEEERYIMKKRINGDKTISFGESSTGSKKKMVGILKSAGVKTVGSDERSVGSTSSKRSIKKKLIKKSEAAFDGPDDDSSKMSTA